MALRLAKAGYGELKEILTWDSDLFLTALEYDIFINEVEEKVLEMNRPL